MTRLMKIIIGPLLVVFGAGAMLLFLRPRRGYLTGAWFV